MYAFERTGVAANPFAVAATAAQNPFSQAHHTPTPPFVSHDLENTDVVALAISVLWGTTVLQVSHLTPPRSYYVGDGSDGAVSDYIVPSGTLKGARSPLVVRRDEGISVVIPEGATGHVDIAGEGRIALVDLIAKGRAVASVEIPNAHEFGVALGAEAQIDLPFGLSFQIRPVHAARPAAGGLFGSFDATFGGITGMSLLGHLGLVAAFAFFVPRGRWDDYDAIERDSQDTMKRYLDALAERETEKRDDPSQNQADDANRGGSGERAAGDEGTAGNPTIKETNKRYAVAGRKDNPDPHLARQAELREAAQFGIIGLIATTGGGDPNAPTAPWGRDDSNGTDDRSARGNMFGDTIGDAFGAGGMGLSGVGEGGGGHGRGIGIDNFGGLGHGRGGGPDDGIGHGRGQLSRGHDLKRITLRDPGPIARGGHLPPEIIQRTVRMNFGRFRSCYEAGLRNNPTLSGRVGVKFVIDREGAVSLTADGGSDLPDQGVVQCVVRNFGGLSFPKPEGGTVTVVYPIVFSASES